MTRRPADYRRKNPPTKAVHIPVFCTIGDYSGELCRELNRGRHVHSLSHVTFHKQGVGPLPHLRRARTRDVSREAPLIIACHPSHQKSIREAYEDAGETPPRIINVFDSGTQRSPEELLKEIADHLRKEDRM